LAGKDVADMITLDHLQGAYIGIAGKYQAQGADKAKTVTAVESLDEVMTAEADGKDAFVSAPGGGIDFGRIDAAVAQAIGRQAAPIRLRAGDEASGLKHIELRHGEQIAALGYDNVAQFVADVATNFSAIYQSLSGAHSIWLWMPGREAS
jgi:hypothetical protein